MIDDMNPALKKTSAATMAVLHPGVEAADIAARDLSLDARAGSAAGTAKRQLAPRLSTLRGKRLAMFENGKVNGREILVALSKRLEAKYGIAETSVWRKPDPSTTGVPFIPPMLKWRPDLVLTALGD